MGRIDYEELEYPSGPPRKRGTGFLDLLRAIKDKLIDPPLPEGERVSSKVRREISGAVRIGEQRAANTQPNN